MENLYTTLKHNKTSMTTEPSVRLPYRPGGMYEDHGSSLRPGYQQKTQILKHTGTHSRFKPSESSGKRSPKRTERAATRSSSQAASRTDSRSQSVLQNAASSSQRAHLAALDLCDDSEDELDLIPSSQADEQKDLTTFQQPMSQRRHAGPTQSTTRKLIETKDGAIDDNGRKHDFHKNFPPSRLSQLKFKRTKLPENSETTSSANLEAPNSVQTSKPPSSKKENGGFEPTSMAGPSRSKGDIPSDTIHVNRTSPLKGKPTNSNRRISSPSSTPTSPPSSSIPRSSQTMIPSRDPGRKAGPPTARPKPRPIGAAKAQVEASTARIGGVRAKEPSSSQPRAEGTLTDILGQLDIETTLADRNTSKRRSRSRSNSRKRRPSPDPAPRKPAPAPFSLSPFGSPEASSSAVRRPKPKAAEFPMDFASSHDRQEEEPRANGRTTRQTEKQKNGLPSSKRRSPGPFPMASSNDKGKEKGHRQAEEMRGRTRAKPSKEKSKKVGKSLFSESEADDDDEAGGTIVVSRRPAKEDMIDKETQKGKWKDKIKKSKVQDFPMSTQMWEGIGSSPLSAGLSGRGKRSSEGGSGDERISKRSRKELDALLQSPTHGFEDEGDSMMLAPNVDPRTLCPFCDTLLPSNPSPLLVKILVALRKKATRDPRPSNPLGLKAPMTVFVTACQRHRFESQVLPEAEAKGWPKSIAWTELAGRVLKMKTELQALIEDPGDKNKERESGAEEEDADSDWEVPYGGKGKAKAEPKKKGAKGRSIFWCEVMEEVKLKGTRAVTGVRGQFANFEKAQPGYYGEQGSVIIIQTLYNMFPLSNMDPTLVSPLTANEFVQKILVPEVALRLIMEDKGLEGESGKQDALVILRESSAFGVAMFPEDGGDWGGSKKKTDDEEMGVGDMIVMERARKRRKELEEEERQEQEEEEMRIASEKEEEERREIKRPRPRAKARPREEKESSVEVDIGPLAAAPPKPRPRPIVKGSSNLNNGPPPLAPAKEQLAPTTRRKDATRSRSRNTHADIEMDSDTGIETAVEMSESDRDSDFGYRASSIERLRSPSASESRRPGSVKPSSKRSDNQDIPSSQTDASSRAVVNGGSRITRSRSRSVAGSRPRNGYASDKMAVDRDSDSDSVEVVGALIRTPVQKRTAVHQPEEDTDDTPRASKPPSTSLAPLVRLKLRKGGQASSGQILPSSKPPLPSSTNAKHKPSSKRTEDFGWLLSSSSQETS